MAFDPSQARDANGKWSGGLVDSLEHQLRGKGHAPQAAHDLAKQILIERGHLDPRTEQLTEAGHQREEMGRRARRVDRMARQTGHEHHHIGYQRGRAFVK